MYKIHNTITGDFYVGSTVDFVYRKWCHIKDLREGKHHSPILQNSWNKHGEESFSFEVLEEVDSSLLVVREQFYIDTLNPRFNICRIAGSPLGIKHTEQARQNMSEAHKGHNRKGHKKDCKCALCYRKKGTESPRYIKREKRLCVCNCGNSFICMINSKRRFINGHNKSQLGRKKTKEQIEKQRKSLKEYYEKRNNRAWNG